DVGHFVADVHQADHTPHGIGVVHFEGVVQRKGVHVDHRGGEPRLGEQRHLVLNQFTFGGDQKHGHLEPFAGGIQNLEVELDVLHIEGNVLLRLPTDHLAGFSLAHAIHRDLLDDHVASTHRDHDLLGLDSCGSHQALDRVGHDPGVHDHNLDDRVVHHAGVSHLGEDWIAG